MWLIRSLRNFFRRETPPKSLQRVVFLGYASVPNAFSRFEGWVPPRNLQVDDFVDQLLQKSAVEEVYGTENRLTLLAHSKGARLTNQLLILLYHHHRYLVTAKLVHQHTLPLIEYPDDVYQFECRSPLKVFPSLSPIEIEAPKEPIFTDSFGRPLILTPRSIRYIIYVAADYEGYPLNQTFEEDVDEAFKIIRLYKIKVTKLVTEPINSQLLFEPVCSCHEQHKQNYVCEICNLEYTTMPFFDSYTHLLESEAS